VDFPYWGFAAIILANGLAMGMFSAPNQTGIMNSLPPDQRGAGAGIAATFTSSAQVLSIGFFFTLMILGLATTLPSSLFHGLVSQGVSTATARKVSGLPPVGSLFAAFLGYNPIQELLGSSLSHLPLHTQHYLTSRSYFPALISKPFSDGLKKAFDFAALACFLGAVASLLRGGKYHHVPQQTSGGSSSSTETAKVPETPEQVLSDRSLTAAD
jgi:hypothetical protein